MKASAFIKILCISVLLSLAVNGQATAQIRYDSNGLFVTIPKYSDNEDAQAHGLDEGALYRTPEGVVKVVYAIDPNTNIPPEITLTNPSDNITIQKGETVSIEWTDYDPEDDAEISLYYDPNTNDHPWEVGNNHMEIISNLPEDPDGDGDRYSWNTNNVGPGTYSIWAKITDGRDGHERFSRAVGLVTINDDTTCDWDLLCEKFDNLDNWTIFDSGTSYSEIYSEIDPPGNFLHQVSTAGFTGIPQIASNISPIGSGDYTLEFRIQFTVMSANDFAEIRIQGSNHSLQLHFDLDKLKAWNGNTYNSIINHTWATGVWYTIRLIIHNNQTNVDAYLDGVLQSADGDCGWNWASQDGRINITTDSNGIVDAECYIDYFMIDDGQKLP